MIDTIWLRFVSKKRILKHVFCICLAHLTCQQKHKRSKLGACCIWIIHERDRLLTFSIYRGSFIKWWPQRPSNELAMYYQITVVFGLLCIFMYFWFGFLYPLGLHHCVCVHPFNSCLHIKISETFFSGKTINSLTLEVGSLIMHSYSLKSYCEKQVNNAIFVFLHYLTAKLQSRNVNIVALGQYMKKDWGTSSHTVLAVLAS